MLAGIGPWLRLEASVSERKLGLDLLRRPRADAERGSYFLRMPASPFSSALRIAEFMAEPIVGRPNLLPCRATDRGLRRDIESKEDFFKPISEWAMEGQWLSGQFAN